MAERLPTKDDFVPHPPDLDEVCAWEHFGGLTLEEAKARFAENALCYQEDFMFMGTNAFLFYFPVLDHYLRSAPDKENDDDYESWIISQCIRAQFEPETIDRLQRLIPAIVDLAKFIHDNISRFGCDESEQRRVATSWSDLVSHIDSLKTTGRTM
ncbi:MAG: hypothetical protein KatS3mg111_4384 [Pirellulaceae bacterium]|nr:MAG: hypothetical protein KatS3mg111_4166 [Pirellulaceae bacterium]GIX01052.1 MAG: hypothetical protein KatS3mg111_4384 [Pirellulaceae bacterium]